MIIVTSCSPSEMPEMNILFFHLDAGFCKPQNGQAATERLMSFRQLGQSREFFWLVFDMCVYYPNISMVVDEKIYLTVTNTRNYISREASVGKIPALLTLGQKRR
jgi:hypothetical protein